MKITEPLFFENCFTVDEIQKILDLQNIYELQPSKITGEDMDEFKGYRISENFWIPKNKVEHKWIYDRILSYINIANKEYMFNLSLIVDDIQFSVYKSHDNGNYSWHDDIIIENTNTMRKISISVQLSDSNEYEGGDLEIIRGGYNFIAPKKIGTIIIFPSFLVHRVKTVTKGKRISLVLWIDGPAFK
jgi:PKHD-type hydroxylase